jgi:hypothetical protein
MSTDAPAARGAAHSAFKSIRFEIDRFTRQPVSKIFISNRGAAFLNEALMTKDDLGEHAPVHFGQNEGLSDKLQVMGLQQVLTR